MKLISLILTTFAISQINIVPAFCLPDYMKGYAGNIRSSDAAILKSNKSILAIFSMPKSAISKQELPTDTSTIHSGIVGVGSLPYKNILYYEQFVKQFNLPDDSSVNSLGSWFENKEDHDVLLNSCPY